MRNNIKKRINKKQGQDYIYISIFFITLSIHFFLGCTSHHASSFPTEILDLSAAATLSGRDWSSLLESAPYYGTGFYILFTPLFMVTKDAIIIRHIILFVLDVMVAVQATLAYIILNKYLNVNNKIHAAFLAVILSFTAIVHSNVSINEIPLEFIMWIVMFLSLFNMNLVCKIKRSINTVVIFFLLMWSRTIHERALTYIIVYFLAIVVVYVMGKKKCIEILPALIAFILGLLFSNIYITWCKGTLWSGYTGINSLTHEFAKAGDSIVNMVFCKEGITSVINIILSQIYTADIYSCGIFIVAIYYIMTFSYNMFVKIYKKEKLDVCSFNKMFIIICFGFSMIATIGFMSISCLKGVMLARAEGKGSRVYTFLRYFYIYVPPLLMIFLADIKMVSRKIHILGTIIFALLSKYEMWILNLPLTVNAGKQLDRSHYFSPFSLRKYEDSMNMHHFIITAVVIMVLHISWTYLHQKSNNVIYFFLFMVVMYEVLYTNINYISGNSEAIYSGINTFKEEFYEDKVLVRKIDKLYIQNSDYVAYLATFEMGDIQLISNKIPDRLNKRMVILSNKDIDLGYEAYKIILDDDEIVYFTDADLLHEVENRGYIVKYN